MWRIVWATLVCAVVAGCAHAPLYAIGPYRAGGPAFFSRLERAVHELGYEPTELDAARGLLYVSARSGSGTRFRVQSTRDGDRSVVVVLVDGREIRHSGDAQRMSVATRDEYRSFMLRLRRALEGS
jgi:hypothetical protein